MDCYTCRFRDFTADEYPCSECTLTKNHDLYTGENDTTRDMFVLFAEIRKLNENVQRLIEKVDAKGE